jgi:hypothetical protein
MLLAAALTVPWSDVRARLAHPSPANIAEALADVASAYPGPPGTVAEFALRGAAVMLRHPAALPMATQTQLPAHRGR